MLYGDEIYYIKQIKSKQHKSCETYNHLYVNIKHAPHTQIYIHHFLII